MGLQSLMRWSRHTVSVWQGILSLHWTKIKVLRGLLAGLGENPFHFPFQFQETVSIPSVAHSSSSHLQSQQCGIFKSLTLTLLPPTSTSIDLETVFRVHSDNSPSSSAVKNLPADVGDSLLGLGRFPGGGNGNSLQHLSLTGESHEQKSLVSYNPWDWEESDTTEHTCTHRCFRIISPSQNP